MSKTKSSTLPHYELLYIISNKFSENEVPAIKNSIEQLITDNQGEITLRQDWNKKKLAYPIKHFRHGYYQLLEFDIPATAVKIINNNLRLSDQILRHQIVKKDKNLPAQPTQLKITTETEPKAEPKAEPKTEPKTEPKVEPVINKVVNKPVKSTAEDDKVELQDLDDKLDKILDSESFF